MISLSNEAIDGFYGLNNQQQHQGRIPRIRYFPLNCECALSDFSKQQPEQAHGSLNESAEELSKNMNVVSFIHFSDEPPKKKKYRLSVPLGKSIYLDDPEELEDEENYID